MGKLILSITFWKFVKALLILCVFLEIIQWVNYFNYPFYEQYLYSKFLYV